MRTQIEVQRAHDLLIGVLLDECPLVMTEEDRKYIHCAADVCCWILQHDHNTAFVKNLMKLEADALVAGYAFDKEPRNENQPKPVLPQPSGVVGVPKKPK